MEILGPRNIDELIGLFGGCGCFQFVNTFLLLSVKIVASMSMIMMSFGIYNPGWSCMDNVTMLGYATHVSTSISNDTDLCQLYTTCRDIQFQASISTIISQWSLVCDRAWLASLIISIQMAGVLVGAYLSGYFGDKFGRKRVMYIATFFHAIFNLIGVFSNSWEMFAATRFFIGSTISFMMYLPVVLSLEFAPTSWRSVVVCFPVWSIGCTLFALSAMLTQNWQHLHAITSIASVLVFVPFLWVPESLRWLVVKNKMMDAYAALNKIVNLNGNVANSSALLEQIALYLRAQSKSKSDSSCLNLMRKGFRYPTVGIGVSMISMSMIYFALSFSIKSLPGNLYTNMFLMFASEIPLSFVTAVLPNYIGRKKSAILFLALSTVTLFSIVGLDLNGQGDLRVKGILVCAMLTRVTIDGSWETQIMYVAEIYPTIIRSTSIAYTSWIARIGGILAPYLIPKDPETHYISYLIMGSCALICCILISFIHETKGKPLNETWEAEALNSQPIEAVMNCEDSDKEQDV